MCGSDRGSILAPEAAGNSIAGGAQGWGPPLGGPRGANSRRGSAALLLLMVLAVGLGLGAWMWLSSGTEAPTDPAAARAGEPATAPGTAVLVAPTPAEDAGPRPVGGITAGEAGIYTKMERSYDGTGSIRGEVRVHGAPYPDGWTLELTPSLLAAARDRAVSRTIQSEPGQRDFELLDLPMAGYRITVRAPGLAANPQEVALFKLKGYEHLPGVNQVNVSMTLKPIAYVDGAIRTHAGEVADGLRVYLAPQASGDDSSRKEAVTDISGLFRFDDVSSGDWMLYVGSPVTPTMPPVPVRVGVQPVRMDEITLPPLGTLRLIALDALGRGFPDVKLTAYLRGQGVGNFTATTDGQGEATVRYLTPGPWRVRGDYQKEGDTDAQSRADIQVVAGENDLVEIHMKD